MKNVLLCAATMLALLTTGNAMAQRLDKMQWFNEPSGWEIKNSTTFVMQVPAKIRIDWRITHYGFTVDDAPFTTPHMAANLK